MAFSPAFISCRYPQVRSASMVHTIAGPQQDRPAHLLKHLLRSWALYLRAFSCPRRAQRWSVGLREPGDSVSIPPVLSPEDGRVVRVEMTGGQDLFDLAQAVDCARFLLAVAADESVDGVRVVPARVFGALLYAQLWARRIRPPP